MDELKKLLENAGVTEAPEGKPISSIKWAKGHPNQKFYDAFKEIARLADEAQYVDEGDAQSLIRKIEEIARSQYEGVIGIK